MALWDTLRDLDLVVERFDTERQSVDVSSEFTRVTTTVVLTGRSEEGRGEDVTYTPKNHDWFPKLEPPFETTLGRLSAELEGLRLFDGEPEMEGYAHYRRWAFESAALDLALRQLGRPLAAVLGRPPRPVKYVVSMRLGNPSSCEPVSRLLERYPGTRFKLDPRPDWDEALCAELRATGAVDSVDLKGFYENTPVDLAADPDLYRRVAEAFPDAWIEDPRLTPDTDEVLRPHRHRITWDAPIHSIADIEALPFPPRMVNLKPSRFGALEELCNAYDHCAEVGIGAYGGGQTELGAGRGQIQYLASLFHSDAPNDVAPREFNWSEVPDGLERSPLRPAPSAPGFRWG